MSGEGLLLLLVGAPAIVLTGTVLGGYVAHRYSPTYLAIGLGAVGGGITTAVALPLVIAPMALSVLESFGTIPSPTPVVNGSKTSPPSPPSL
jgi:hypothetical protein